MLLLKLNSDGAVADVGPAFPVLLVDPEFVEGAPVPENHMAFAGWAEVETYKATLPVDVVPELLQVNRVLKDTIIQRVKAQGKLSALRMAMSTLSDDDRFEWDQSSWFHSNNNTLRVGLTAIGCDPDQILAFDPLAP